MLVLATCCVLPGAALAQGAAGSAERIRGDVAFLADDALQGRDTGSPGYDTAADYVAARFQTLGLTPAGDAARTQWRQPVRFSSGSVATGSMAWAGTDGTSRTWSHGGSVAVLPGRGTGPETRTAGLVFVGYGIDAPAHGFDDYRDLDVRGKFVLAFAGAPGGTDSELAASLSAEVPKMAAARGALGVVYLPKPELLAQFPWDKVIPFLTAPRLTWVEADGRPHDAAQGVAFIDQSVGEALFAGAARPLLAVQAEAGPVRGFPLAGTLTLTADTALTTIDTANVAGLLPGSDPALGDQVVIVMAHLDHIGLVADPNAPDRINNGALDNASGVATMLEVARALSSDRQRPRRSVLFLAVTGEEKGLLGSASFAANPPIPRENIAGVVNLDMPILLYDFTDVVAFGAEHSTLGPIVAEAANSVGLTVSPDPMPEEGLFTRSDHYSFVERGVPSVFLATGHANGGAEAWAGFLGGAYHGPDDDLNQPINWSAAAKFALVNTAIARAIADAEARPLWYEGDVFGDRFAPDAEKAPRP